MTRTYLKSLAVAGTLLALTLVGLAPETSASSAGVSWLLRRTRRHSLE